MATKKTATPMSVNSADDRTAGLSADPQSTAEAAEQPQETRAAASLGDPRIGAPNPPTGLVGHNSRDTVARITVILQGAQINSRAHADAWEAAANALKLVSVMNLHPAVAKYKAEALDYLRGKQQ